MPVKTIRVGCDASVQAAVVAGARPPCAGECAGSPATSGNRAPPPEDAREYYPLETGWQWAYDDRKGRRADPGGLRGRGAGRGRPPSCRPARSASSTRCCPRASPGGAPGPGLRRAATFCCAARCGRARSGRSTAGTATVSAVGKTVTVPAGSYPDCVVVEENRSDPPRAGAHDLRARGRAGRHRVPGSRRGQRAVPDGAAREPARCDTARQRPTGVDAVIRRSRAQAGLAAVADADAQAHVFWCQIRDSVVDLVDRFPA